MKSLGIGKSLERHRSLEREGELFFETLRKLRGIKEVVKGAVFILFIPFMFKRAKNLGQDDRCSIKGTIRENRRKRQAYIETFVIGKRC